MGRRLGSRAAARAIWPACVAAAKTYDKSWLFLSGPRLALMAERLREYPSEPSAEILVEAIHGAIALWRGGRGGREGFDARRYLTPETVYRKANFAKYLEAAREHEAASRKDRGAERTTDQRRSDRSTYDRIKLLRVQAARDDGQS